MFDKAIVFKGKHGEYVRTLAKAKQIYENDQQDTTLFKTNIQLCLLAPIIGVLFNRKADEDKSDGNDTKIMFDTVIGHQDELNFVFKVVILSMEEEDMTYEKKMNRAFRYNYSDKDENTLIEMDKKKAIEAFEAYTRGGIEFLYEKIYKADATRLKYIDNVYEFIANFYNDTYNPQQDIFVE